MILIFRHLHQTTLFQNDVFASTVELFPGVMEPGAALPRPPLLPKIGLLCPQYGCSALLWTLQHCHSCSCSTWLRASATTIHIQHCRETTMQEGECRITLQARIASWALEAWERPPRKTDLSLSQEESQVSWICCKRLKNGSIPQTEHPYMMNFLCTIPWYYQMKAFLFWKLNTAKDIFPLGVSTIP